MEQATFSLVRHFNEGFTSSYGQRRCFYPFQVPSPCQHRRKQKKTNISCRTDRGNSFGTRGWWLIILEKVGQVEHKQKQVGEKKHLRVSLIEFDEAGRQGWAAAHNHCGSINPSLGFFFFFLSFGCFFIPQSGPLSWSPHQP